MCEGAAGWYLLYRMHKRKEGPMKHYLKTDPGPFKATWLGEKTFEIRYDDRGYRAGDELVLVETVHTGAEMKDGAPLVGTGRVATAKVLYVMRGPIYGLADGWVIMAHMPAKPSRATMAEGPLPKGPFEGEF